MYHIMVCQGSLLSTLDLATVESLDVSTTGSDHPL